MAKYNNAKTKIYAVKFISYTDSLEETVYNEKDNSYINLEHPLSTVLVREDELEKYKQYGDGYESINLVGYLVEEEPEPDFSEVTETDCKAILATVEYSLKALLSNFEIFDELKEAFIKDNIDFWKKTITQIIDNGISLIKAATDNMHLISNSSNVYEYETKLYKMLSIFIELVNARAKIIDGEETTCNLLANNIVNADYCDYIFNKVWNKKEE